MHDFVGILHCFFLAFDPLTSFFYKALTSFNGNMILMNMGCV